MIDRPNILIDFHHSDLLESMYRLLEDRLGARLYVPRGIEWHEAGIWQFGRQYPDGGLGVARQFLLAAERDELQPQRDIHWVTLDDAARMEWAVVLASVPDNYDGYRQFATAHNATFAIEVGNVNQGAAADCVILDSTGVYPQGVPFTPEFDLSTFKYVPPRPVIPLGRVSIASFVNLFPHLECWPWLVATDQALNLDPAHLWDFRIYGHVNEPLTNDGFVKPTAAIADIMQLADFAWHDKITGDGFGYVIHYWAAIGRPMIGHASHYAGQLAIDLWQDGATCIDLDRHPPQEAALAMQMIVNRRGYLEAMGHEINRRLMARLDWEADAERVRLALRLPRVNALIAAG